MSGTRQRTVALEVGCYITFEGQTWQVAGLDSLRLHLVPTAGGQRAVWLTTQVVAAPDFRVLATIDGIAAPEPDPQEYTDHAILDTLTAKEHKEVQRKVDIVQLMREGRLPGQPEDPELVGLSERKRRAILVTRFGVSDRAIKDWAARFRASGVAGLVDRRLLPDGTAWAKVPRQWREAFRRVLDKAVLESAATDGLLIERARAEAAAMFGDDVPVASDRSLRRYLDVMQAGRGRHLSKKAQASIANVPDRSQGWRPITASRVGQYVLVDTNVLDVFALDPVTCEWQRLQLLLALDLYSRSIVGWRFTAWEPTADDVSLLLRNVIAPKSARDEWPAQALWRYTGVPEAVIAGLLETDPLHDRDLDDASIKRVAGVPVIVPDALVLDHGKVYMADQVKDACQLLGVSLEFGRPYTPTDKAHVERVFGTINSSFCQRLPGYKGSDVFSRGNEQFVEDAAFLTIDEVEERFAAWVALEYQNAPHDALRHPGLARVALTPNQMVDVSIGHAGYVPVPVDRHLQIELLTTEWRHIDNEGITYKNLRYDFADGSFLDDYRGRKSPYTAKNGKWRIKVDRRDLSRVWLFAYTDPTSPEEGQGQWVAVPLRDIPEGVPFQERHLAHAKHALAASGGDVRDRASVVKELRRLLANIYTIDGDAMTVKEKRLAAHAHAQRAAAGVPGAADLIAAVAAEPDDSEGYYTSSGLDDDDADETTIAGTVTRKPRPARPSGARDLPTALAIDADGEWDPFADDVPDIA